MSRRKILILGGIVLIVAIFIPIIRYYQLRAVTEAYIAELKAKGEPMDLAQVIPPPVPPEKNGAPTFLKAASMVNTNWDVLGSNPPPAMRMVAPGKAMVGWAQPEIHSEYGINSWEDIRLALAKENDALNLLRQIADHLALDFKLNYAGGYGKIKMAYLSSLKRAAQGLSASAIFDLHRGDSASAVKDAHSMLLLANAMQHDRLIISELVRMAIAQMASGVNWEILQSTNITGEQLVKLQHDWMHLDFIRGDENALAMERVMGQITGEKWRSSNSELQNYFDTWFKLAEPDKKESLFTKAKFGVEIFRWRYWWSYPDELRMMKGYQIALESARFAEANFSLQTALHEQENELSSLGIDANSAGSLWFSDLNKIDLHSIMSASVLSSRALLDRVMRAETTKQIMITAIALKRYQLKYGNYLPDLDSLVPEFLSSIPLDPVDGKPLRYRLNTEGTFLLYSVGENGKDDGGDPSLEKGIESSNFYWQNPHALDWVWPQPATPEEVQRFYAHPPK
jgi:hypothetical protein